MWYLCFQPAALTLSLKSCIISGFSGTIRWVSAPPFILSSSSSSSFMLSATVSFAWSLHCMWSKQCNRGKRLTWGLLCFSVWALPKVRGGGVSSYEWRTDVSVTWLWSGAYPTWWQQEGDVWQTSRLWLCLLQMLQGGVPWGGMSHWTGPTHSGILPGELTNQRRLYIPRLTCSRLSSTSVQKTKPIYGYIRIPPASPPQGFVVEEEASVKGRWDQASLLLLQETTKRCPQCSVPVERDGNTSNWFKLNSSSDWPPVSTVNIMVLLSSIR